MRSGQPDVYLESFRSFNWQHRSNAWGTYLWVKNEVIKMANPLYDKAMFETIRVKEYTHGYTTIQKLRGSILLSVQAMAAEPGFMIPGFPVTSFCPQGCDVPADIKV